MAEIRPRQATAKGPADWFTGDVWIDSIAKTQEPVSASIGAVHFTPGARTAWHRHSIGQTLYVTEGEGRIQSKGEPVVTIRAGDVVWTGSGQWHWHGAAPGNFMTHISIAEGGSELGGHVTDDEYHSRTE